MKHLFSLLLISIACLHCTSEPSAPIDGASSADSTTTTMTSDRIDHHSFANPKEAMTKHLDLELTVDFELQTLSGKAQWQIVNNDAEQIIFDTRALEIEKVTTGVGDDERTVEFTLSDPVRFLGQALNVKITPETEVVTIYYKTTDGAAALDWLEPQQTGSKQHPFLFTQGQAILTRSWVPCQDSPGIRITYDAKVTVPKDLMAVMSASNPQIKNQDGVYAFEMKQPIPPYLMALAVGDLQFAPIGQRTGVYAEPYIIQESVNEFADMEKMLIAAELLYGEYPWERYDVIVLPPSFPFGGMENPRLTFATPTIIAGDRSLVSLIAHELAHSWSGNLVTNATWDDFWLNEGFTVYFERRIMEALYGKEYVEMLAQLGRQDLNNTIKDLTAEGMDNDTKLKLNLRDRDPDEGMTDIAYEKGALFLTALEKEVGRDEFDKFLKEYFDAHKFQTITTTEFVAYLNENLIEKHELDFPLDKWLFESGIPEGAPEPSSSRFANVESQLKKYISHGKVDKLKTEDWSTHEWLHFIRQLPDDLDTASMQALDTAFGLTQSGNAEIQDAWYELAIYTGYSARILPQIEAFLVKVGRRKFLTPLYKAFKKTDQLDTARAIFSKAKPNYHSVSSNTIEALLEE